MCIPENNTRELQLFNNPEFGQIEMIEFNGKPYAVGNSVAGMLEYSRPHEAVTSHCKGAVTCRLLTEGGMQDVKIIPEGDIYRLTIKAADQSKNPNIREKAEKIERWIFDEVIPSIRKTGEYAISPKTTTTDIILNLIHNPNFHKLKASAQVQAIKEIAKDNKSVSSMNQNLINAPGDSRASDLLQELLSHAVPITTYQPRSETELKSSVLYDEKFFYIFPFAAERYIRHPNAKKLIGEEVKFLDGVQKAKRFKFLGDKKAGNPRHVLLLPRRAVRGNDVGNVIAFPSALVGGDTEK